MTLENVSAVTSFIFMAYIELQDYIYLYFTCLLFLYIVILLFNLVLIFVIVNERGLQEPMYLLLCNLLLNSVYASTVLLPSILVHLSSQNYEISVAHCLLQTYSLYIAVMVEYTCLALMAYDRYVAICHPLLYHLLMSPRKAYTGIVLSWIIPGVYFALYFILSTVRLTFCDRHIDKVFCSTVELQTLSCSDTSIEYTVGMTMIIICPGLPLVMILFSYTQILRICLSASRESQIKALQTCTPHLMSVINFTIGILFEIAQYSFDVSLVTFKVRIFMSLYIGIIPPLFNPIIYGIFIQAIRVQIFKLFIGK